MQKYGTLEDFVCACNFSRTGNPGNNGSVNINSVLFCWDILSYELVYVRGLLDNKGAPETSGG